MLRQYDGPRIFGNGCERSNDRSDLEKLLKESRAAQAASEAAYEAAAEKLAALKSELGSAEVEVEHLPRPLGMAEPEEVTPAMKAMQWKDPQLWSLSMAEFCTSGEHCMHLPEYIALKRQNRFVTMYDICNIFVKKWSAGTGNSICILDAAGSFLFVLQAAGWHY